MSGRRKTACAKCIAQKLRCSGKKPSCQRCSRLRRQCVYSNDTAIPSARANIPASVSEKKHAGVSSALVNPLIDTFFAHVYNASLLLHRPSLNAALERDTVPPALLLGVCAFAAKFHRNPSGRLALVDNGFCHEWAERASRLAFEEVQFPREDNVAALINLALFWYSEGEFRRSAMHECCATTTAVTLGFHKEQKGKENLLESEIRRRRFWACFLVSLYQSQSLLPSPPNEEILDLRLPCREEDYQLGAVGDSLTLKSDQCNGSINAQFVRATIMWTLIHKYVRTAEQGWSARLTSIQTLDGKIQNWWSKVSPSLKVSPSEPALLTLQIVYHMCLCVLHSSIVPLFSWGSIDEAPSYARQLSAQTAFEHANSISSILASTPIPLSRIPGLAAYATYAACAIQIPFLRCLDPTVKQQAHVNVFMNLNVLQAAGVQWKFIELLGKNVRWIFNLHTKYPLDLPGDPLHMDPSFLSGSQLKDKRARLSILTHNQIIIGEEGAIAKSPEDIEDFGEGPTKDMASSMPYITDFELNNQIISSMDPMTAAMFPSFNDLVTFDVGFPLLVLDEMDTSNSGWHLEDWMDELLKAGSA